MQTEMATTARGRAVRKLMGVLAAAMLVAACEGAKEVQQGAQDYDNADSEALQKQIQDTQRQVEERKRQQQLLEQMQQDCQDMPMLVVPDGPVRTSGALAPAGTLLLAADLQLAWGGGGGGNGGGGDKTHDRTPKKFNPCP